MAVQIPPRLTDVLQDNPVFEAVISEKSVKLTVRPFQRHSASKSIWAFILVVGLTLMMEVSWTFAGIILVLWLLPAIAIASFEQSMVVTADAVSIESQLLETRFTRYFSWKTAAPIVSVTSAVPEKRVGFGYSLRMDVENGKPIYFHVGRRSDAADVADWIASEVRSPRTV